jgi:hypothetical protein
MTNEISLSDLKKPSLYGPDIKSVKIIQTHISYVVLTGKYAYKIKKPVNFGFLDFSTLEKRKYYCQQELKLNKRLCPDIYLEVLPITKKNDFYELNGEGEPIEYTLKMKEFPQEKIMTNQIKKDNVDDATFENITDILVNFYRNDAQSDEVDSYGDIKVIKENTDENFSQTEKVIGKTIDKKTFDFIKNSTNQFLMEKKQLFEKRIKQGYINDCHGDLHTGNIVIDDGKICIFDCIEFNKRFRYGDVASDIGFLAMDLDFLGFPYYSSQLIENYSKKSKDADIYKLINFYKSYRAYVRGKVTGFKLDDPNISQNERESTVGLAKKYFDLSYYYSNLISLKLNLTKPILFITCGLTGTGKTTIAKKISQDYNSLLLSTDLIRKKMEGINIYEKHHDEYNKGLYSPEKMQLVYDKLIKEAEKNLKAGKNVVLDATFKTKKNRDKARFLARNTNSKFLILNSIMPENLVKKYLNERVKRKSVSDGRWEIYEKQKKSFEYLSSSEKYIEIDVSNKEFDYQLTVLKDIVKKLREE